MAVRGRGEDVENGTEVELAANVIYVTIGAPCRNLPRPDLTITMPLRFSKTQKPVVGNIDNDWPISDADSSGDRARLYVG